jgi:transcriptional regulator with XRE-family HTH domain
MRSPGHEAEMDRYAVARLVREWRAAQRLSTVRAAEVLGLAKSVLSDLEHARTRYPTGPTLTALRDIVGVPASYLTSSATLPQVDGLTLATLPAYLRQYRRVHGLTQEQMAEDLDCSPQTVKSLEYGKTQPSAKLLTALSAVLGVSIALTSQEETRP